MFVERQYFLANDTLLFSLPFSFSFFLAVSFDCCFGSFHVRVFSVHTLGYHCPLSYGSAIFSGSAIFKFVGGGYRITLEYPNYSSHSSSSVSSTRLPLQWTSGRQEADNLQETRKALNTEKGAKLLRVGICAGN